MAKLPPGISVEIKVEEGFGETMVMPTHDRIRRAIDRFGPARIQADPNDPHDMIMMWNDGRVMRLVIV